MYIFLDKQYFWQCSIERLEPLLFFFFCSQGRCTLPFLGLLLHLLQKVNRNLPNNVHVAIKTCPNSSKKNSFLPISFFSFFVHTKGTMSSYLQWESGTGKWFQEVSNALCNMSVLCKQNKYIYFIKNLAVYHHQIYKISPVKHWGIYFKVVSMTFTKHSLHVNFHDACGLNYKD